jgi:hypothetical protein
LAIFLTFLTTLIAFFVLLTDLKASFISFTYAYLAIFLALAISSFDYLELLLASLESLSSSSFLSAYFPPKVFCSLAVIFSSFSSYLISLLIF